MNWRKSVRPYARKSERMKKLIVVVAILMTSIAMTKPENHLVSSTECKEVYENIKALLDQEIITIEEAQKMWLKWEEEKHNR